MARTVCRIAVTFLVLVPSPGAAQQPLTLEAAVRTAVARNASLRAVRAGVDEAVARAAETRSAFFPRVSFAESAARGDQPVFVFSSLLSARRLADANFAIDRLNHPDPIGFFRTTVGIEQVFFDGGRQRATADAATERRRIAEASRDEAAAALVIATTQTFGRVVSGDAIRRAADAGVAAAREDLLRAERRRDAGLATDADVLALAVQVADVQQRAIQAGGDAAVARAELNKLTGAPVELAVEIVEPPPAVLDEIGDRPDMLALFAEADRSRPELKRMSASQQVVAAARRQVGAALMPLVAAQGNFEMSGTRFADRASSWTVGAELRWTFSTGGAELAALKAAAASIVRTDAEAEDVRGGVHVEVVGAVQRLASARARYTVARAAVDQARESQRIIRDRFEAGIAPVNDVLRAATAVLDAEINRVTTLVEGIVAVATLRRALGRAL